MRARAGSWRRTFRSISRRSGLGRGRARRQEGGGSPGRRRARPPAGPTGTAPPSAGRVAAPRAGADRRAWAVRPVPRRGGRAIAAPRFRCSSARKPQLFEPGDLSLRERFGGEVGEWRRRARASAASSERLFCSLGLSGTERLAPFGDQALKPVGVQLAWRDTETVAGRLGDDRTSAGRAPSPSRRLSFET